MEGSELRIGNIVQMKKYIGIPTVVTKWEDWEIIADDIFRCATKPDNFRPIELTEKWLIDFGFSSSFEGSKTFHFDFPNDQYIEVNLAEKTAYLFSVDSCTYGQAFDLKIQYVHQLQNLYFALTGQELKTNQTNE